MDVAVSTHPFKVKDTFTSKLSRVLFAGIKMSIVRGKRLKSIKGPKMVLKLKPHPGNTVLCLIQVLREGGFVVFC